MKKRDIKTEMAVKRAQSTKNFKKEIFDEVMAKEKMECLKDVLGIYYGLSGKIKERIVLERIYELAGRGLSPREIIERLQIKK